MIRHRSRETPVSIWYNNRKTSTRGYAAWTQVASIQVFSAGTNLLPSTSFDDELFVAGVDYWKVGSSSVETKIDGSWAPFAAHPRLQAAVLRRLLNEQTSVLTPVEIQTEYTVESMTDHVVKDFKRLQSEGRIINNPMSSTLYSYQLSPVKSVSKTGGLSFSYGYTGVNYNILVRGGPVVESVTTLPSRFDPKGLLDAIVAECEAPVDSAVADAYAKLQDADLNLAMMAAEGRETYNFINDKLLALARILQRCKDPKTLYLVAKRTYRRYKSRIDKVGWTAKQLSEAYLEVRYAVRPLMYDIEDLIAYFTDSPAQRRQNRYTFRRRLQRSYSGQKVYGDSTTGIFNVLFSGNATARAGVIAEKYLDVPGAKFGFTNLASIVWEKVKFSFILDWIINISGFLYMLNPNLSMRPLAAWSISIVDVTAAGTWQVPGLVPTVTVPFSAQCRIKTRIPVSRPPYAVLDINLDPLKILDLIAITGNLKGGKAPF